MLDDTVVAIATPPGRGGIGVLRISGPGAIAIAGSVLSAPVGEPNRAVVTDLVDGDVIIDRVVATTFRKPHSYTG
jgi:tRNA modification GTPase